MPPEKRLQIGDPLQIVNVGKCQPVGELITSVFDFRRARSAFVQVSNWQNGIWRSLE